MSEAIDPKVAFQSFGAEELASILAGAKQERQERADSKGSGTGGGYIPTGYPQPGVSKFRIFLDPERKMYRGVKTFKVDKKRVMDPRFFLNGKDPAGTEVPKELTEQIWSLQKGLNFQNAGGLTPSYTVLAYIHLIEAEKPDEKFWKPGTTYVMAGNGKFEEALLSQISSLSKGVPLEMAKALNPMSEGWAFEMNLVKGQSGSVSLTPTIGINYPGIELTPAYKPLREQFVPENIVFEDQTALVDALKAKRVELGLDEPSPEDAAKTPTPPVKEGEEKPTGESAPSSTPVEEKKADPAPDNTGAGVAGDSWEDAPADSTPVEEKKADPAPAASSDEKTYGLTEQQIGAAKAANIGLKQFAEMMGIDVSAF